MNPHVRRGGLRAAVTGAPGSDVRGVDAPVGRRRWAGAGGGAIALAVGLVALAALLPPSAGPARSVAAPAAAPAVAGPCGGAAVPTTLTGTLAVEGGAAPGPSVANRTVVVYFQYELNYTGGGAPSVSCDTSNAAATTGADGSFDLSLVLPSSCSGTSSTCRGPLGPTTFALGSADPPGYFFTASRSAGTVSLAYVAALDSIALTPYGRTTVSENAAVTLTAAPLAGNGGPSPAYVGFAWTVSGTEWTVESGAGTGELVVDSPTAAATTGTIWVYVNGTYNGSTESATPAEAILTSAPTIVVGASVAPTSLDAGTPANFSVNGTGAGGYAYALSVYPGLGGATVTAPCASTVGSNGLVVLSCHALVTYGRSGVAAPTATLSNGYASDDHAFPDLSIAPGLSLSASPDPVAAYVGTPTALTVAAAAGSGTDPLGPACLWPGDGSWTCDFGGGPTWTFTVRYPAPGSYSGHVTVADAARANVSTPVAALVASPPSLDPLVGPGADVGGSPITLSSAYADGALPAAYWWNDSLPTSTIREGTLTADGPLSLVYAPVAAGDHTITLTVIDGLGTLTRATIVVAVSAGPATTLEAAGAASTGSVAAGIPYPIAWAALDRIGEVVPTAAPALLLVPAGTDPAGPVFLNDSAGRPIVPAANGSFPVGASAWSGGRLNLTFTALAAGTYRLVVASALAPGSGVAAPVAVTVVPDTGHLRLTGPVRAATDPGVNHTRWRIADRFGNALADGFVVVRTDFGGIAADADAPIEADATGSFVWVNFSVPVDEGGTVVVVSAWNETLLGPLEFPAPSATAPTTLVLVGGVGVAAIGCLAVGVRGRREERGAAPGRPPAPPAAPEATEAELRRLAEARAHLLARADPAEARTLAELVAGWTGTPPDPAEVAEWVSGLVAEGLLAATVGPDRVPRFVRVDAPAPPPGPPKVEIDAAALEAALARRPDPEPADGDGDDDAGPAPPP